MDPYKDNVKRVPEKGTLFEHKEHKIKKGNDRYEEITVCL